MASSVNIPREKPIQTDVAVVGAGPIGLELAIALKKAGIDYLQYDAHQIGYTISWFAPQTRFFSSNERIAIAGVPLQTADQTKSTREEYLKYLRQIVLQYDLSVNTFEPVTDITQESGGFRLTTKAADGKRTVHARRVVLATGGTARPRRLNIDGEDLPHVDHYFRDPHLFFRKRLLVVGGKNSAVEAALRCYHAGADVTISYRRENLDAASIKYWLSPEINGLMSAGKIRALFETVPTNITRSHVEFQRNKTGDRFSEPFDFVLLLTGYEADSSLLECAGVELRGASKIPVFDEATMQTNVSGLYVAGCAVGGTQDKYALFLENCHVHVPRIVAALTGKHAELQAPQYARPET
jgi:thioredoxin reductase (NADPH)